MKIVHLNYIQQRAEVSDLVHILLYTDCISNRFDLVSKRLHHELFWTKQRDRERCREKERKMEREREGERKTYRVKRKIVNPESKLREI